MHLLVLSCARRIGRRVAFIVTLSLVILGSFASAFVFDVGGASIFVTLALVRFVLGFGIGGEYPLAATITSESSAAKTRGRSSALVFSMQGIGFLMAPCLALALFDSLGTHYDLMWRLLLGFGAIPGLLTVYWRVSMHETSHFEKAASVKAAMTPGHKLRSMRRSARVLAGTALNWLLLDVTFYANGLFSGIILSQASFVVSTDVAQALRETIVASIYLGLMAVPGYFCAVLIIDKHGRKPLQLWGFLAISVRPARARVCCCRCCCCCCYCRSLTARAPLALRSRSTFCSGRSRWAGRRPQRSYLFCCEQPPPRRRRRRHAFAPV